MNENLPISSNPPAAKTKEEQKNDVPKHHKYSFILNVCKARLPIYLFGPTGSGKTHIFRDIAKELNLVFYKKLIGAQMSESSLLGYMDAHGRYVEGIVFKPYTEGGLLVLDEIDNGNPNTNLVVNGVCDTEIAFPCGMFKRHKDFVVVATANTTGNGATLQYVGRNKLDKAMLNRFLPIEFLYDLKLEERVATDEFNIWFKATHEKDPGEVDKEICQGAIHDFWRLRDALKQLQLESHILSQRNLLQSIRLIAIGGFAKEDILKSVLTRDLNEENVNKAIAIAKEVKIAEMRKRFVEGQITLSPKDEEIILISVKEELKKEMDKAINELRNARKIALMQIEQINAKNAKEVQEAKQEYEKKAEELRILRAAEVLKNQEKKAKTNSQGKTLDDIVNEIKNTKKSGGDLPNWDEKIMGL